MPESTIAIIIFLVAIVLYVTEVIPVSMTSMLAVLAMIFSGVLTVGEAFSGFSNQIIFMVAGMFILGEAVFQTGLAQSLGKAMMRIAHIGEKKMVLILFIAAGLLSVIFNSVVLMALAMPIIDSLAVRPENDITRKGTYLAIAMGGLFGGNMSVVGGTSLLNAIILLEEATGYKMSFFEPALLGAPGFIIGIILYSTIGYSWQKKCFDFPDVLPEATVSTEKNLPQMKRWKRILTGMVFVGCVVCFVAGIGTMGVISLAGAVILIITRCVDEKTCYRNLSWQTIIVAGGSIGFGAGIQTSGAAEVIAQFFIDIAGPLSTSPFFMCIILLFVSTMLSNFMSNNATVVVCTPIALILASMFNANPVPFVLSVGVGTNIAMSTPICVTTVTMTTVAGYRVKDYLRVGGLFNIAGFLATVLALKLFYF